MIESGIEYHAIRKVLKKVLKKVLIQLPFEVTP